MAFRMQIYKIVAILLLFLIFLQYLYLYPVKLNFSYAKTPPLSSSLSSSTSSSLVDTPFENSLFYFKTFSLNKKRSPAEDFNFDDFEGNRASAKANNNDANSQVKLTSTMLNSKNVSLGLSTASHHHDHHHQTEAEQSYSNNSKQIISKSKWPVSFKITNKSNEVSTNKSTESQHTKANTNNNLDSTSTNDQILPLICPTRPPTLIGNARVSLSESPSLAAIGRIHSDLSLGGRYKPPNCRSKDKVAIIVPFRDREEHLRIFLYNILPFLKRQQIEFNIFVIEQGSTSKDEPFNRAMLFNVGYVEANKRGDFDCFIFHDVDLLPENDYNLYNCPHQPRHMSVAVDKMKYKLPYRNLFGGISALTKEHFQKVNGFSNSFWGWGAEDDDMAGRIAYNGLYISRPPPNIARYKMLKHKQQKLNNQRYRVLQKGKQRFKTDGLSSLKYAVEQVVLEKTYTLVRVLLQRP